jgi:hypothetical protein
LKSLGFYPDHLFLRCNDALSRRRSGGGSDVGKNLVRVVYAN